MSYEIPQGPWKFISQDLFKQGVRWYSVTVDPYSDCFEVDLLNEDITAVNVISVTKAHFARYGTPDAKTYGFKLITRSPYYARATGKFFTDETY